MVAIKIDKDGKQYFDKDPVEKLDYSVDWTDWLNEVSDTIASALWTVPSGIEKKSEETTATRTTIWVSGGTENTNYVFESTIFTTAGRKAQRSFRVKVKDR